MIAIDTETTGLLKPDACDIGLQPELIEIYACKFNWSGEVLSEFKSYVKPTLPIPEFITEITHITNEMVEDAPAFYQIYNDLVDFFLGERTVFAHNCPFDMGMLKNELKRQGLDHKFPWPHEYMCTAQLSIPIKNKRLKLDQLYDHVTGGKKRVGSHRAKNDVMDMLKCIVWLKENGYVKNTAEHSKDDKQTKGISSDKGRSPKAWK